MAWHKMRNNLKDDPRVVAISTKTGVPIAHVVGACSILWALMDEHGREGFIPHYTPTALDTLVSAHGFSAAMASVGWLAVDECGLRAPNWDDHNGASAKDRIQAAKRQETRRNTTAKTTPHADADRHPKVSAMLGKIENGQARSDVASKPDGVVLAAIDMAHKRASGDNVPGMVVSMIRTGAAEREAEAVAKRERLAKEMSDARRSEAEREREQAERTKAETKALREDAERRIDSASHLALKSAIQDAANRCPRKLRDELAAKLARDPPIGELRELAKRRVVVLMVGESLGTRADAD